MPATHAPPRLDTKPVTENVPHMSVNGAMKQLPAQAAQTPPWLHTLPVYPFVGLWSTVHGVQTIMDQVEWNVGRVQGGAAVGRGSARQQQQQSVQREAAETETAVGVGAQHAHTGEDTQEVVLLEMSDEWVRRLRTIRERHRTINRARRGGKRK